MIKVLEVCTVSSSTYALVFKRAQAVTQQSQRDIQVDILCTEGDEVALMRQQGTHIIETTLYRSLNPIRLTQSLWALHKAIRDTDYDVIHLHFGIPGLVGRVLALLDRKRTYIYQSHGYSIADNTSPIAKRLFLIIEKVLKRSVPYSLFQLRGDMELARQHQLLTEEQMVYIGNGVDMARFTPSQEKQDDIVRFGMVARFEPIKNQALLIDAAYELRKQTQNFKVLFIGQGELKEQAQQHIKHLGLESHIEIMPYTHDMPSFYQSIDVGVLTSFAEGIPRALIEPMASGKPVIATDVKGSREAPIDGTTGFLTPLGEPKALADKMFFLMQNPEQRLQMGKAAREHALANFSEQDVINKLEAIYRKAANHTSTKGLKTAGDHA